MAMALVEPSRSGITAQIARMKRNNASCMSA